MKRITAMVVCLSFVCLAALTASSSNTEAAPGDYYWRVKPVSTIMNDLLIYTNEETPSAPHECVTNYGTGTWGNGDSTSPDDLIDEADDDPGYLYWGDDADVGGDPWPGTFGAAQAKFILDDPTPAHETTVTGVPSTASGVMADYYVVNAWVWYTLTWGGTPADGSTTIDGEDQTVAVSIRTGLGYTGADTGSYEYMNESRNITGASGTSYTGHAFYNARNEVYERPFTMDEVNHMYFIVELRFDAGAISKFNYYLDGGNIALFMLDVLYENAEYTPPVLQTGSFILRPNGGANYSSYMTPYPVTERYLAVDETPHFGDGEVSYLYSGWTNKTSVPLTFDDTPSWASAAGYTATLWAITRETVATSDEEFAMALYGSNLKLSFTEKHSLQTAYTNQTLSVPTNPGTNISWTLDELDAITASFIARYDDPDNIPTGDCRITQVAILCTPSYYTPPDVDFGGTQEWLATGNGFMTIFAIFGFIGLCATPVLAVFMLKEGDQSVLYTIAMTIFMGTMFFFLFWFGIS